MRSFGAGRGTGGNSAMFPGVVRNLRLVVGGKALIDGVDLTLEAGSITVVMGPNGAGKSTLLRLLHGLVRPSAGDVTWGGAAPDEALRRRQAMVFQRPVLLRRSAAANIDFVLRLRGNGGNESKTGRRDEVLELVGLSGHAEWPARRLSIGEQQRLALARALALEPAVLFLDEPTANLDPASMQRFEDIVRTAHARGTKIVFVTHDVGQARRLADEVVFLHHGRVMEHTSASRFFDGPDSEAARDYLAGRIVL